MATVVGILIHEQFFFAFVPLLAVSVAFGAAIETTAGQRRLAWAGAFFLLVLGLCLTLYISQRGIVSVDRMLQLRQSIMSTVDRPLDDRLFNFLPATAHDGLETMKVAASRPTYMPAQVESLLLFGPTAIVLVLATSAMLRQWRPIERRWLFAGVLLATLAPLSLNLVGWDKNRWNELLCLNGFLMLLLVSRMFGGETVELPLRLRRTCFAVMLLNMASGGGLMGNLHIRPFPFLRNPEAPVEDTQIGGAVLFRRDSHPCLLWDREGTLQLKRGEGCEEYAPLRPSPRLVPCSEEKG